MDQNSHEQIITTSSEHTVESLEGAVQQWGEYFRERQKDGWPGIQTSQDLFGFYKMVPFLQNCIEYKKTGQLPVGEPKNIEQ